MKTKYLFLFSVIAVYVLVLSDIMSAQTSREFNYNDFDVVSVGYGMNVTIEQASGYKISVETENESDLKNLKVEQKGDKLQFFFEKNYRKKGKVNIHVSLPELAGLNLSGGSKGKLTNKISDDFYFNLSGGSTLSGNLSCTGLDMNLSGGSRAELKGESGDVALNASGGSYLDFNDFQVEDLNANLSGGSSISVKTNGNLNIAASGGSKVTYFGEPKGQNNSLSGGSKVVKGN